MAQELEKFFKDLPAEDKTQADIFNDKKTTGQVATKENESDNDEPKKNRHARRFEAKYQAEREANIALAAKLQAMTEMQNFKKEVGSDVNDEGLKNWLRIYGDKPEHREAYEVLKNNVLAPITKETQELKEKLEEISNRDVVANQQVKEYEGFIDQQFERLEDDYDIDLTDEKLRNKLIDEIKRISPKDEEGNIKEYGDFDAALENVLEKEQSTVDTGSQKRDEIASRSMANSGGSSSTVVKERTKGFFGWKHDLKL
jgi:hypothetical protein